MSPSQSSRSVSVSAVYGCAMSARSCSPWAPGDATTALSTADVSEYSEASMNRSRRIAAKALVTALWSAVYGCAMSARSCSPWAPGDATTALSTADVSEYSEASMNRSRRFAAKRLLTALWSMDVSGASGSSTNRSHRLAAEALSPSRIATAPAVSSARLAARAPAAAPNTRYEPRPIERTSFFMSLTLLRGDAKLWAREGRDDRPFDRPVVLFCSVPMYRALRPGLCHGRSRQRSMLVHIAYGLNSAS